MHKPSSSKDYGIAAFLGLILSLILGIYFFFRLGYFFEAPEGLLYVPNKVIGGVSVLMLAIVFLTGPVVRYFDKLDHWIQYRKEIGIVGGFLAIAHGVISIWFIPEKFSFRGLFLSDRFYIALAGLIGALLFLVLIIISWKNLIQKIGGVRWWFLQRWGLRLVVLATALHVIPMKWPGWVTWFEQPYPWLPPASLLLTLFLAWVVVLRLYESIFLFHSWGWQTKEISTDPTLRARGRRFFLFTLILMVIITLVIFARGLL